MSGFALVKLSALRVKNLTEPGRYGDGGGLWLQVRSADQRSWGFRYKLHGRSHWVGLGPCRDVTLAEARDAARDCRRLLAKGVDPLEHRRAERASRRGITFREVAEAYMAAHAAGWRNPVHRKQWASTLATYAYPVLGDCPVADVTVGDVLKVLEPIWREVPETAGRLRGRIEAVLDFAMSRGWRTADNPARWRGHLQHALPARAKVQRVEHHAALPYAEIAPFMARLRAVQGIGALALEWTILTAARTGETIGATWQEIDLAAAVWTVPAVRMKGGREHRVPLSGAALAVLRRLAVAGCEGYVFRGAKRGAHLSNMAMAATLQRRLGRDDLTVHGFRSTFRDWAADSATSHPREVAEACLAHALRDKVEAAYRRSDLLAKRRELLDSWSTFCAG